MDLVILWAFVIALLIVVAVLCFSIISVLRIRADKKGAEPLVDKAGSPMSTSYLDAAPAVPATGPVGVGYMDEGYKDVPTPAPATRAPAAPAPAPVTPSSGPAGVGYMDEPSSAPATPAHAPTPAASGPVGVGYMDEPSSAPATPAPAATRIPAPAPVGVGYLDV